MGDVTSSLQGFGRGPDNDCVRNPDRGEAGLPTAEEREEAEGFMLANIKGRRRR
jgi:hypothetical protein